MNSIKRLTHTIIYLVGLFSFQLRADADRNVTEETYREILDQAQVWQDINTSTFDVVQGVGGPSELQAAIDAEGKLVKPTVECEFKEPKVAKSGGKSAKFECTSLTPIGGKTKRKLKVKYDPAYVLLQDSPLLPPRGYNGEVYSEVAASRLLTALGYKTDAMYPVRVICHNCPEEPFSYITKPELRATMPRLAKLDLPAAVIEIKADGDEVGVPVYEATGAVRKDEFEEDVYQLLGWGLDEIRLTTRQGLLPDQAVAREALVLLLGWLQHADNKASNQRLVCTQWTEAGCTESYLIAQDLGSLWGKGVDVFGDLLLLQRPVMSKFDYSHWKQTPVWKKSERCELKVNTIPFVDTIARRFDDKNTLENKQFSQEALQFLLDRLNRLSDAQLLDLFTVAQVDLRNQRVKSAGFIGPERVIKAQDWVKLFKERRAQLGHGACASL